MFGVRRRLKYSGRDVLAASSFSQLRLNQSRLQLNLQRPSKTLLSSFSFGTVGKYLECGLQLILLVFQLRGIETSAKLMGLVKLMTQCVVIGNCETVENCACDRKLLSVHCGADCTFSARFLSWCPRPAISFKGHQYLYFALSMELIFNFQDKTSQKLRNCPNSRYSKYSRYSSIVKFGRNCEIWSTPISLVWKGLTDS